MGASITSVIRNALRMDGKYVNQNGQKIGDCEITSENKRNNQRGLRTNWLYTNPRLDANPDTSPASYCTYPTKNIGNNMPGPS